MEGLSMERKKRIWLMLFLTVIVVGLFNSKGIKVKAADDTEYTEVWSWDDISNGNKCVKKGKYYLKGQDGVVYISKNKKSGYKKTSVPYTYAIFANSKQAYYMYENVLYKITFSNRRVTKLKDFNKIIEKERKEYEKNYNYYEESSFSLDKVYKNKIYITRGSFIDWEYDTYVYSIKNKTFKCIKKYCTIVDSYKEYCICQKEYKTDVSPYTLSIYKITSSGMKKVKELGEYVFGVKRIKGTIYYVSYSNYDMKKGTLYRCKYDGTHKEKLGTFAASGEYGYVYVNVSDITSKSCTYVADGKNYKYVYSKKKSYSID
jgi:hypothetical protein